MTRQEIIEKIKPYFKISELVCDHVYRTFGDKAWQFLSTNLLHTILILRTEIFKTPMMINGGAFGQRGLRCNLCQLVKDKTISNRIYVSAHMLGEAIDFDVKGYTAEQARKKIHDNIHLLPHNIRLEKDVNWVHIDMYDTNNKIYQFKE